MKPFTIFIKDYKTAEIIKNKNGQEIVYESVVVPENGDCIKLRNWDDLYALHKVEEKCFDYNNDIVEVYVAFRS